MNRSKLIASFFLLLFVSSCGGSAEPDGVAEVKAEALEITWEQLMPKGEEDKLEALYSDYYEERERQFQEEIAKSNVGEAAPEVDTEDQDLVSIIVEGSANDTMDQIGTFNVVEELNGKKIRLPGYVVPFDFSSKASYQEFLLVPYFGACLHTPPPPPNQIVFVKAEQAANIENIYDPVWVEGVLKTGRFDSDLANSAYELSLEKVEAYAY